MKTICKLGRVAFSLMGLPDIAGLQTLAFCEAGDLAPSLSPILRRQNEKRKKKKKNKTRKVASPFPVSRVFPRAQY